MFLTFRPMRIERTITLEENMSRIRKFVCFFAILGSIVSSLLFTSCGMPPAKPPPLSVVGKEMYSMGSCDVQARRAAGKTCAGLQDRVRYGLFKAKLYERIEGKAPRKIRMTITYFRPVGYTVRTYLGLLAGKCGMDVKVEIVDRENGKIVRSADISGLLYYGTKQELLDLLSDKIVEFLISVASE